MQQPALSTAAQDETAPREILVMLHLPAPHFRPDGYHGAHYRDDAGRAARRRIAEALAREHGLLLLEDWAMPVLNVDCYRMQLPPGTPSAAVLETLARDARVKWAQSVNSYSAQAAADPLYPVQPAAQPWQLAQVRNVATGRQVLVAVLDSGVDADHPDLAGQVPVRENFVDGQRYAGETHGTAVAGVIAALAGNGIGIEGVAPGARLMALRACWQLADGATRCNSFTLGKALNFALLHGAHVINMSLSGPDDRLLQQLIDVARARGVRVVGAYDATRADGGFPASHPGVFAVLSEGAPQSGSPSGPPSGKTAGHLLAAPGRDVPTTLPGARYGMVSGASYAAAHVSGMMAVLSELKPRLPLAALRASLVPAQHGAVATSIDFCATVTRITGKCPCGCAPSTTPAIMTDSASGSAAHFLRTP
ncbi:MAG: S8 family serine peptidase [Burkholderiaceae bacterium]|nr:S8 family serine peptidase [Burkholderiaceae bacterium]